MTKKFIAPFWLLAVIFNIVNIWMVILFKEGFHTDNLLLSDFLPDLEFLTLDILFTFTFSLPGVFALSALVWIVREFIHSVKAAWSLVCIGCSVITLSCYLLMELILQTGLSINDYLPFLAGSLAAVWVSLMATRKRFFSQVSNMYNHAF